MLHSHTRPGLVLPVCEEWMLMASERGHLGRGHPGTAREAGAPPTGPQPAPTRASWSQEVGAPLARDGAHGLPAVLWESGSGMQQQGQPGRPWGHPPGWWETQVSGQRQSAQAQGLRQVGSAGSGVREAWCRPSLEGARGGRHENPAQDGWAPPPVAGDPRPGGPGPCLQPPARSELAPLVARPDVLEAQPGACLPLLSPDTREGALAGTSPWAAVVVAQLRVVSASLPVPG